MSTSSTSRTRTSTSRSRPSAQEQKGRPRRASRRSRLADAIETAPESSIFPPRGRCSGSPSTTSTGRQGEVEGHSSSTSRGSSRSARSSSRRKPSPLRHHPALSMTSGISSALTMNGAKKARVAGLHLQRHPAPQARKMKGPVAGGCGPVVRREPVRADEEELSIRRGHSPRRAGVQSARRSLRSEGACPEINKKSSTCLPNGQQGHDEGIAEAAYRERKIPFKTRRRRRGGSTQTCGVQPRWRLRAGAGNRPQGEGRPRGRRRRA